MYYRCSTSHMAYLVGVVFLFSTVLLADSVTNGRVFLKNETSTTDPSFLCPSAISEFQACCNWERYAALDDYTNSTVWEKPQGHSNFLERPHPVELPHDPSSKTLSSLCETEEPSNSSRTAIYQSVGNTWADGTEIRLKFWYKIDSPDDPNSRLTLSVITPFRDVHTIWTSLTPSDQWTEQEIVVKEIQVYQIRFTAVHKCDDRFWLSGITAKRIALSSDDTCLPSTTTKTTTTIATTTTHPVELPPILTMRPKRFRATKRCDFWTDCDPRFDILYTWIDDNGVQWSRSQYFDGGNDVMDVTFPISYGYSVVVGKGSRARMTITVTDADVFFNDHLETFVLEYIVPHWPPGVKDTHYAGNAAELWYEFRVSYR